MQNAPPPTERPGRDRPPGRVIAIAVLAGVALVCGILWIWPPGDSGFPLCATKAVTGLDCPFCGGLRAVSALLHGHPIAAADHNLLVLLLAPLAISAWLRLFQRRPPPERRSWIGLTIVLALVIFTVARNLPTFAWLASGAS